jgi:hypothetical protein
MRVVKGKHDKSQFPSEERRLGRAYNSKSIKDKESKRYGWHKRLSPH